MGAGIAQNFAQGGLNVKVSARHQETLDKAMVIIEANLKLFDEFKLLDEPVAAIMARIQPVLAAELPGHLATTDFILETIPEVMDAKRETFAMLDKAPADVVIASNTGSFTVSELCEGMQTPARVVGAHYFNPPHIIPAVEVHTGKQTDPAAVEVCIGLLTKVGKKPVRVRQEVPGFIVNRLTGALEREIDYLLDNGVVTPEDLDVAVMSSIGFRFACLGPMEIEDMIGLDTACRVAGRVFPGLSNADVPSPELVKKVEKGELGIKAGKGWFDYTGKTTTEVNDEKNRRLLPQLVMFMQREKGK